MASSKTDPTAGERTPPEAAIETLALWLNLQEGEVLPLNRLARQAGLAWATTSKYVALIERLQNLVPRCERTPGGIRVTEAAAGMRPVLDDEASASALALMIQARSGGHIEWRDAPIRLQMGFNELQALDAVEQRGGTWALTPSGWVLANDAYGEALESRHKPRNGESPVLAYVSEPEPGFTRQASTFPKSSGGYRRITGSAWVEQASRAA